MIADTKKTAEQKMAKALEALKNNFAKVRTGRAHAGMLDVVQVDYYGAMTPINGVASVTLLDARTIGVQPYEKKMIQAIEKAIREADLGLNPSVNSDIIRVPMPMMSEERRKELVKLVKGEAEDARVAIRNVRRDANNALKDALKAKTISEDEERRAQDDVQKLTDKTIAEVDKQFTAKEAELMSV
ncbi:MAG TPA: ribosome recycling factor [Casimicrobium huifangae]|jgi:ribosome recycling factor|uniref:ribosome recycling factor n=1 Tax=Casimicrobium huifangae TaxID=2591109 RepID=UPI0012EC5D49|nr:ribosome recycling factor [Casimicrobium huifangae]HOB02353.1 ribosome recycling factor [Casimicrobium huifangae]HQA35518.1 ribosome recycling factor [Casimicrobium huifangae]